MPAAPFNFLSSVLVQVAHLICDLDGPISLAAAALGLLLQAIMFPFSCILEVLADEKLVNALIARTHSQCTEESMLASATSVAPMTVIWKCVLLTSCAVNAKSELAKRTRQQGLECAVHALVCLMECYMSPPSNGWPPSDELLFQDTIANVALGADALSKVSNFPVDICSECSKHHLKSTHYSALQSNFPEHVDNNLFM